MCASFRCRFGPLTAAMQMSASDYWSVNQKMYVVSKWGEYDFRGVLVTAGGVDDRRCDAFRRPLGLRFLGAGDADGCGLMSLLNPQPDPARVEKIVAALDKDDDGTITAAEVKVLFSRILKIPEEDIPDDHEDGKGAGGRACLLASFAAPLRMPAPDTHSRSDCVRGIE